MQFFLCFFFSLFPVPTPSFLSAITSEAKGRRKGGRKRKNKREGMEKKKKGFSTWLETKITSRKEVTLGGNCFWSLKGEK